MHNERKSGKKKYGVKKRVKEEMLIEEFSKRKQQVIDNQKELEAENQPVVAIVLFRSLEARERALRAFGAK